MSSFLVVDENEAFRTDVSLFFGSMGHSIDLAPTYQSALAWLDIHMYEVVIANVTIPGGDIHKLIRVVQQKNAGTVVIALSSRASIQRGVLAVRGGAFSMLQEPFSLPELNFHIRRALNSQALGPDQATTRTLQPEPASPYTFIGECEEIQKVLSRVNRVARTNARVIILGETGTGKELVASAIHHNSLRADGPFVRVNCAALPEALLESELFGYEKGSFTGADRTRIGRFEHADGGTMFLDEVADMSLFTQAKVLRVIQEKEFERIGSNESRKVDVRIISATNKDLIDLMKRGMFREDLYFRLNVVTIRLPPLRKRDGDVKLLAEFFLKRAAADMNKAVRGIDAAAMQILAEYSWPGNIRELENTMERAVLFAEGELVTSAELELLFADELNEREGNGILLPDAEIRLPAAGIRLPAAGIRLEVAERQLIEQALERTGWVQKDAAELLGLTSRALNYRISSLGITHPSWKRNR